MRMKPLRRIRYNRLMHDGFLPAEAQVLSQYALKRNWNKVMRRERRMELLQARKERWTKKKWKAHIDMYYKIAGWNTAYDMMRYFRRTVPPDPDYTPPKRKPKTPEERARYRERYPEKVREQKRLWHQKQEKQKPSVPVKTKQVWIEELDASIQQATGVRREQLMAQRARLMESIE